MTEGRAGGLLRELPVVGLEEDVVPIVEVRVPVDSLGAAALVKDRVGGWMDFVLSSLAGRSEVVVLSITR